MSEKLVLTEEEIIMVKEMLEKSRAEQASENEVKPEKENHLKKWGKRAGLAVGGGLLAAGAFFVGKANGGSDSEEVIVTEEVTE